MPPSIGCNAILCNIAHHPGPGRSPPKGVIAGLQPKVIGVLEQERKGGRQVFGGPLATPDTVPDYQGIVPFSGHCHGQRKALMERTHV